MQTTMKRLAFACILLTLPTLALSEQIVKIGVLACQTGGCAATGQSTLRGIEIAVEEINAAGGVLGRPLEIIAQDTKEADSAANSVAAFRALSLDPTIELMIGPSWSNGGMPLIPLIKQRPNLIITSPSLGISDYNEASDRIFNTWPHDRESSIALARWAIEHNLKTAGILSAQDPWTASMAKEFSTEFEKLGGKILAQESPLLSAANFKAEITRIRNTNPEFILLGYWDHAATAARELHQLGWHGQLGSVQMDQEHLTLGGKDFAGLAYATFASPKAEFIQKFKQKYKADPGLSADTAYDTIYLYKRAIESAKTFDIQKLKLEILKQNFEGVSGKVEFDRLGGVTKKPLIEVVTK